MDTIKIDHDVPVPRPSRADAIEAWRTLGLYYATPERNAARSRALKKYWREHPHGPTLQSLYARIRRECRGDRTIRCSHRSTRKLIENLRKRLSESYAAGESLVNEGAVVRDGAGNLELGAATPNTTPKGKQRRKHGANNDEQ